MSLRSLSMLLCACALVVAGCSGGSDEGSPAGATTGATPTTPDGATGGSGDGTQEGGAGTEAGGEGEAAETGAPALTLTLAETSLGQVLADGRGHTVYLFTPDKVGKKSVCTGPCTEVWIPVRSQDEPAAGEGVDASLISTIERPDGSEQVTYKGHPLYTLIDDESPGDVKGQSVGGVWFAVTPAGEQAG